MNESRFLRIEKRILEDKYFGGIPFGYNKDGSINENEAKIIKDLFTLYSHGDMGAEKILDYLKETYKISWHKSRLIKILSNKFYTGILTFMGKEYPHKHGILISKDLFEKAQEAKKKSKRKPNSINFYEKRKLAKNCDMKDWHRFKLEKGEWLGTYPMGYKVEKKCIKKFSSPSIVTVDKENSIIVQDIFRTYASGSYSLKNLTDEISRKYGKKLFQSHVHQLLKNKFYIGIMTWKGFEFKHEYPIFISDEVFNRCQLVMKTNMKNGLINNTSFIETIESSKSIEEQDVPIDILYICKNGLLIDDIMSSLNISLEKAQSLLFDFELEGKIKEIGPGVWKTK